MPRYEIEDLSDGSLSYVDSDLPLNLAAFRPAGNYVARAMSGNSPTITVTVTVGQVSFSRNLSRAAGVVVIDLDTIGTVTGTPVYSDGAGFPSNGITRAGNLLSINVEGAADGTYVIRREDDGPQPVDIAFTFTGVPNTWEFVGGDLVITGGTDDPDSTAYSLTPDDGPFEGQTAEWTWGQVPALNPSGDTPGLSIFAPTVAIQSGGQSGQATTGTVLVRTDGIRAYRDGATPSAKTVQWLSGSTVLSGTGLTYTVGAEPGPFTVREDDGGPSVAMSNAIPRASAGIQRLFTQSIYSTSSALTVNFPVDTSALTTGDRVVLAYTVNSGSASPSFSVGGGPALGPGTFVGAASSWRRVFLYEYVMPAPAATTTFVLANTGAPNGHLLTAFGVRGGALNAPGAIGIPWAEPSTGQITPGVAGTLVLAVSHQSVEQAPYSWTGATDIPVAPGRAFAAFNAGPPAGTALTVTFTGSSSAANILALIPVQPL